MNAERALTLWPEWLPAFQVMGKLVENRSWSPPARHIGTRIALHSGMNIGGGRRKQGIAWLRGAAEQAGWGVRLHQAQGARSQAFLHCWPLDSPTQVRATPLHFGAVVATAKLVAVSDTDDFGCPWAMEGQVHWLLGDLEWLADPVVMRGHQGLWGLAV
jgi:hypothetical protein